MVFLIIPIIGISKFKVGTCPGTYLYA